MSFLVLYRFVGITTECWTFEPGEGPYCVQQPDGWDLHPSSHVDIPTQPEASA